LYSMHLSLSCRSCFTFLPELFDWISFPIGLSQRLGRVLR
jgi:hypothetical protein